MVSTYERLRSDVLRGQARPEGLGAIVYHGLIEGLLLLCSATPYKPFTSRIVPSEPLARDPELLRVLANMVLQTQSEVQHVY